MAQFGHYHNTLLDSSGNALSGISVTVRKQGATVNGLQTGATITVRDTGGIADGDICRVNAGTSDVGTVLSHTATTITFDQSVAVADLDRLTPRNNLPTLYDEPTGADSRTNPTTTSATGFFDFWIRGGPYDLHMTGTGIADTLVRDVWVQGSNMIVGTHGTPAYILDTNHTLSGADLLLSIRNNNSEKFALKHDGALTLQQILTIAAGGLDVTGNSTLRDTLTVKESTNTGIEWQDDAGVARWRTVLVGGGGTNFYGIVSVGSGSGVIIQGSRTESSGQAAVTTDTTTTYTALGLLFDVKNNGASGYFTVLPGYFGEPSKPVRAQMLRISDGIAAPGASECTIYVDVADGDLKVKFADGITKTLATDT